MTKICKGENEPLQSFSSEEIYNAMAFFKGRHSSCISGLYISRHIYVDFYLLLSSIVHTCINAVLNWGLQCGLCWLLGHLFRHYDSGCSSQALLK